MRRLLPQAIAIPLAAILMAASACSVQAADRWAMQRANGDVIFSRGDAHFSLAAYAAHQVPAGYVPGSASDTGCQVDIDLKPLSLQGDVLSVWVVYRMQPGDCDPPLRNGGTQAVVALHLPDGKPTALTALLPPEAIAGALRKAAPVRDLAGAAAAKALPDLLAQLDTATRAQCDRRITPASLSQFYAVADRGAPRLYLAWGNDCGQLGDEPSLQGIPLDLPANTLRVPATPLEGGEPLHLSFVPGKASR